MSEYEVDEPSAEAEAEVAVHRDDATHTYVASAGEVEVAHLTFEDDGVRTVLVSTTVLPEFRGRGISSGLITHVLDELRDRGRRVAVECPQVLRFLAENRQYDDLVEPTDPAR